MKLFFTILLLATIQLSSQGQLDLAWAKATAGPLAEIGFNIAYDSNGNVITSGTFRGTTDFDPSYNDEYELTAATEFNAFILKLDPLGNFMWATSIQGVSSAYGMTMDDDDNIYICGGFKNTIDFDSGAGVTELASAGLNDGYLAKYNSSGELIWAKGYGGELNETPIAIAISNDGNLITTGDFNAVADFDPGVNEALLTPVGSTDVFISKFDNDGNFLWVKQLTGNSISSNMSSSAIVFGNEGNIYLCGRFVNSVDFDPGSAMAELAGSTQGDWDAFILKLDNDGNFIWVKHGAGANYDVPYALTLDTQENVYTTGYFDGTVDFDPNANETTLTSIGGFDVFVQKLNGDGELLWAKNMGGISTEIGNGIFVDSQGAVYTTGYVSETADFDPSENSANIVSHGETDIFVSKLSADGNYVWAYTFGGPESDIGRAIRVNESGTVFITGENRTSSYFNPNSSQITLGGYQTSAYCVSYNQENFIGVSEISEETDLAVFPNPAIDQLFIRCGNAVSRNITNITISDHTGKLVWQSTHVNQFVQMDVSNLSEGVYTVTAQNDDSCTHQTFVKIR